MIEQTREIVRKFNSIYDEVLVEPDVLLPENEACCRLPGTDGGQKMSKSLGNCIYLADTEADVKKKIMMVVGACIFLIAAAQALPMFFGIGA